MPEARGINGQHYLDILKQLHACIAHIRPELFAANSWILHHNNVPSHMSHVVADWLAKNGITQILHSLYLPDMAPYDFWAFPKLKKYEECLLGSIEETE